MSCRRPCRATNRLFAERYNISETTVRRGLRALVAAGFLRIEMDSSNTVRTLIPCVDIRGNPVLPPLTDVDGEGEQKYGKPLPNSAGTYIRKKEYDKNTAGRAGAARKGRPACPEEPLRPEQRVYTLEELEALNFY